MYNDHRPDIYMYIYNDHTGYNDENFVFQTSQFTFFFLAKRNGYSDRTLVTIKNPGPKVIGMSVLHCISSLFSPLFRARRCVSSLFFREAEGARKNSLR